jgi:hypothetical protein
VRLLLTCRSCLRPRNADLQGLIDAGRGDVPLVNLKFSGAATVAIARSTP